MPDILLDEAVIISNCIDSFCQLNLNRVKHIQGFLTSISDVLENSSKMLFNQHRNAQRQLDEDVNENASIHHIQMIAFASVYDLAKRLKQAGEDIKKLLLKVSATSVKNLHSRMDDAREACIDLVQEVNFNNQRLKEVQKKIEHSMKNSSSSNTLQRSKSGGLLKFNETRHRTEVLITNKMWLQIQAQYNRLIEEVNSLNKSRCEFSRLLFINFISILGQTISTYSCEHLLKEIDDFKYSNKQLVQSILTNVEDKCGRSQLLRNRMVNKMDLKMQNDDQIVKNFKDIEAFSEVFTIKAKINKREFQHARNMIMGNSKWGQYFLGCLCSKLYTEISLDKEKYQQLATMIKIMFASLAEEKGNANIIYKILYISLRVSFKGIHLMSELSKYKQHWENNKRWNQLIEFVKTELDNQNKQKQLESNKKSLTREKSLNFLLKNSNMYLKATYIDEVEDTTYEALREINVMIAKLELDSQFTIRFVIDTCQRLNLTNSQKRKLITYHHKHKKSAIQTYLTPRSTNLAKLSTYNHSLKNKLLSCVQKCLGFLNIQQSLLELLLVNKRWLKDLKAPIFRRFLIDQPNMNVVTLIRTKVYIGFVPTLYTKQTYTKMKKQLPPKCDIFSLIKMDVHRSLNSNPSLKPKLEQLLCIFSYYNDKIGYLQGMNYLGEHLLKLGLDNHVTYTIFQYVIAKHFSDMFTTNFDLMRLRFYQFGRLMEVYRPKMFQHFQNQKIEPEHYLVAWIMTLWGQLRGDVVWILWDGFLLEGWKWWMQVGLWILEINQAQLLEMNFQQILKYLNEQMPSSLLSSSFNDLFEYGIQPLKIKQSIKKYRVNDKMLALLEQEYVYVLKKYGDSMQDSGM